MKSYQLDLGLLLMRLVFGGFMLVGHGWPKLQKFSELSTSFPDPIGLGSNISLLLALGAEIICALLLVFGALTRLVTVPLMITMLVAAFVIHAEGPFFLPGQGAKEPALLFFVGYLALFIMGSGQYSVDRLIYKK